MEIQIQFFSSLMQTNVSSTYQQEYQKLKISKVWDYSLLSISIYVFTINSETKFHPILVFLILISLKDYLIRNMPWSNLNVLVKKASKTKYLKDFRNLILNLYRNVMPNIHYAWDKYWQFFLQLKFHHACFKKLALISIATTYTSHFNSASALSVG